MFIEIWAVDNIGIKKSKFICAEKVLAILPRKGYDACMVVMENGLEYAHHESADVFLRRIGNVHCNEPLPK